MDLDHEEDQDACASSTVVSSLIFLSLHRQLGEISGQCRQVLSNIVEDGELGPEFRAIHRLQRKLLHAAANSHRCRPSNLTQLTLHNCNFTLG